MTEEEKIVYKNPVLFLRKSKAGKHLYAFDYEETFAKARRGSIVMNISDVEALINGNVPFIKISIMPEKESDKEEEDEENKSDKEKLTKWVS